MLKFLDINDENLIDLNLKNTIIINSVINQNNFPLLTDLGLIEKLREKINHYAGRDQKDLSQKDLDVIIKLQDKIYDKKKFYMLENDDLLSASSNCSAIFKETRKILEGI
jgi:hypothetical protein